MIFKKIVTSFLQFKVAKYSFSVNSNQAITDNLIFQFKPVKNTINEAFLYASKYFEKVGVSEPNDSARFLLCKATDIGYSYSNFHLKQESLLNIESTEVFLQLCDRRIKGEPIQYILGDWDFYDMTVKCRSPVLIPRPETEELVDYILKSSVLQSLTNMSKNLKPRLLDVGAGSGVIGLALLNNIPRAECIALDINDDAVQLANENAKLVLKYSDRYQCLNSSFMNFVQSAILKMGSTSQLNEDNNSPLFDIIISNPPYIPTADVAELQTEVRDWEDIRALDGGLDGLDMIKDLIRHSPSLMRPEGTRELWMEVSHLHPEVIQNWVINEKIRVELVETWNDLSGQPRFVRIRYIL